MGRRPASRSRSGLLALAAGVWLGMAPPAPAAPPAPVEFWTVEPNEGDTAGGHSAIRIGGVVHHVEHRGDGLIADRRDPLHVFDRVYRIHGNRSIDVLELDLPGPAARALDEVLREREHDRRTRLDRLAALEEDLAWLDDILEHGRVRARIPGLGLLEAEASGCDRPGAEASRQRLERLAERRSHEWLARRAAGARATLRAALRRSLAGTARPPNVGGGLRGVVEAAQVALAIDSLRSCPGVAPAHLSSLAGPESPERSWDALGTSPTSWASISPHLEGNLFRLLESDRPDRGLAILLAAARLAALDESRRSGQPRVVDPLLDGRAARHALESSQPSEWLAQRRARAAALVARRARELADPRSGVLEVRFHRLERAVHALTHADEDTLHAVAVGPAGVPESRARRVPGRDVDLPWPDGVTLAEVAARRAEVASSARVMRRALDRELGYELFTRNCVTELFDALDEALGAAESTRDFATARGADPEASLGFIPVVAGRIARRQLPVRGVHRLPSVREASLREGPDLGSGRIAFALQESNVLTSRTYRRHAGDSSFLFFTQEPVWARPLLGVANLATGLGATVVGLFTSPVDGGLRVMRGLRGITMSVPELFFFNVRKGTYPVAPVLHRGDGAATASARDGT